MKKLLTLLTTLLLLFAFSPRVMASKKVYLLTSNTVNGGIKGNWGEKEGTPTAPNEDLLLSQVGSTEEYCITLTSTTKSLIYFAFQINNDDNSKRILKPDGADVELTINDANKVNTPENGGKAWKVNFTNAYSQIVIHVNINENKLWVTGTDAVIVPSYLLGRARDYELVISYGTTTKVLPFTESRWRYERNAAMHYSKELATVGFKDEQLPGKTGDKIRIYARKKDDTNFTLNPAVDGSTFGDNLQPSDAKFSSIKEYKTESFVVNKDGNTNAFIITKGSGVSYTVGLNLGEEIKATTKTASGANNNISHKVNARSLSLYVNKSMSEVYTAHSSSYKGENEDFYLIGALTGRDYKKEKADVQKMEREVYRNPITNETDSVVYTSVIRWKGTIGSNLWFAFAPEYLYNDHSLTWESSDPYSDKSRWNYIARAQVQDEYDATAQYGCMNLSGTKGDVLCNGEQALNPKVKDEYKYYMVRFNVTTSTYRLIFYKENPVIIKRSKNKFIRTYCSNASWDLPADGKVKAYVVHSFDKDTKEGMESQGVMKLREIKYIPAEMGVVLVADGTGVTADEIEVNLVSKWVGFVNKEDLWVKRANYAGETFNNYLVGLSTDGMFVTEGDFDEEHHYYVNRNFGLNWFSNTKTGKALKAAGTSGLEDKTNGDAGDNDYLGFFRLKGDVQKEYAYLQLSKNVVNYDLQLTGSKKENNKAIQEVDAKLSPNFGMYFDTDFDFVTGINSVSDVKKNSNNGCYTLQGVKVQRPTAPGLYIMNGKKVIVK